MSFDVSSSVELDGMRYFIKMPEVKISTVTLCTKFPNCTINLINVGKYLEIDNEILGIKYNYGSLNIMKGKYLTTIYKKAKLKNVEKINKVLFYNQISLVLNNNGNNVNIKLFRNGSLHLTGCKSINEGVIVTSILYNKLNALKDKIDILLLTKDENGILLDKDDLVYSLSDKEIIGYCKNIQDKIFVVHKKECSIDEKTNMFITKKIESGRKRFIFNFNGELIGYNCIELLKNRNKLYKKKDVYFDNDCGLIYYNDIIIGKIVYYVDESKLLNDKSNNDIIEFEYSCDAFPKDYFLGESDFCERGVDLSVNCMNVYFTIGYKINRQRFYENLINMNFICKYNPECYSGIKFTYKLPINNDNFCIENTKDQMNINRYINVERGICPCTNKCTCLNITFLIFQSGNVIATGFKTDEQIKNVTRNFIEICNGMSVSS